MDVCVCVCATAVGCVRLRHTEIVSPSVASKCCVCARVFVRVCVWQYVFESVRAPARQGARLGSMWTRVWGRMSVTTRAHPGATAAAAAAAPPWPAAPARGHHPQQVRAGVLFECNVGLQGAQCQLACTCVCLTSTPDSRPLSPRPDLSRRPNRPSSRRRLLLTPHRTEALRPAAGLWSWAVDPAAPR